LENRKKEGRAEGGGRIKTTKTTLSAMREEGRGERGRFLSLKIKLKQLRKGDKHVGGGG